MRKLIAVLLLALLLLTPCAAWAEEGEDGAKNLLYNADFSEFSEQANLPAGWTLSAYASGESACAAGTYEDEAVGACIGITNVMENDARVCQSVQVLPNTCYLFSGLIRTSDVSGGRGATLSIDNYELDGTYCYSEDVTEDSEWTAVELYFVTGPKQEKLTAALRLGGYGTTAIGSAWFADLALTEHDRALAVDPVDLMTETGAPGTAIAMPKAEMPASRVFTTMLLTTSVCVLLLTLFYVFSARYERAHFLSGTHDHAVMIILLFSAFVLRLLLSAKFYGHSTDINCFMAWGNAMWSGGPANFYNSGMFADYPPGYMYVCGLLSGVCELFGIPYGSAGYAFIFKLPATFADMALAYLIYRLARKQGIADGFALVLAALIALNPVLAFVSGAWGQIDSLLTLLLVLAFVLFQKERKISAGAVYGLAILLKPQALMAGPILAAAYILDIIGGDWKKKLINTLLAVLSALLVLILLSLPCKGGQDLFWIVDKYVSTASSYPYASIEAFNFPALLGGNWARVETTVLGLSYRTWGTAFICIAVALSIALYAKGRNKNRGCLYLTAALMIAVIFTFGHYMHERYLLPVLPLLLMAYVYCRDARILLPFSVFTCSALLNVLSAMYIVDHQSARGAYYDALTGIGSAMTLAGCLLLVAIGIDLLWRGHILAPARARERKQEVQSALPMLSVDGEAPERYSKIERIRLFLLIAVYSAAALLNLGSPETPQSVYRSDVTGEECIVSFGTEKYVSSIWVNGNIGTGGTLLITADDGTEIAFDQVYDDMFRWKSVGAGFSAKNVTVNLYAGGVAINEIVFFDENGAPLSVTLTRADGDTALLFDEQDTVPKSPGYFNGMYLDELYHGRTAYEHLHNLAPYENSHPPLGKIFIMLGILVFGMCPFGWRVSGALFGIGMLPVFYALSRRILKKPDNAFVATALFAFDFMHFTQTRIATIDVYSVFFILVMFYFMYRYITMNFFDDPLKKTFVPLGLCGVFFGVGAASKWTSIYAGGGMAVLFFLSIFERYLEYKDAMAHGDAKQRKRVSSFYEKLIKTLLFCVGFYILIPFCIYFVSYTPYYIYEAGKTADYGIADMVKTFANYQEFMYSYHSNLVATHPYQSNWYEWPFTITPMWYFYTGDAETVSTLTASGNPAVWWVSAAATIALAALRMTKRVKPDKGLRLIFVGVLCNYLPWVLVSRCTFIYHFFNTVPFILLGGSYLLAAIEREEPAAKRVKWIWLALGLLFFILLYPGISGLPIPRAYAALLKKIPGGGLMYGA